MEGLDSGGQGPTSGCCAIEEEGGFCEHDNENSGSVTSVAARTALFISVKMSVQLAHVHPRRELRCGLPKIARGRSEGRAMRACLDLLFSTNCLELSVQLS
jgi:hypothetical protein